MPTKMHRRKQHSLARLESPNVLAHLEYFAGNVAAQNVRQLHARQSLAYPHIQMIERARPHPYQHLIFAQLRVGNIFVCQNLRSAELMNTNCFHRASPVSFDANMRSADSELRLEIRG